uniref:major histocompatibility complex class I-related gene protein-like n=1 Tax=Semicossyphus pulcher TaxID=241346 RepID=UPI0037E98BF5
MVNEVQIGSCDSNIKTAEPKHDWIKEVFKDVSKHQEWYSQECLRNQHILRANIEDLMQRFNQSGGVHVLQRMSGCEWDDETGEIVGYDQFGYDGEDFIALDLQTLTWTASKPQAFSTKLRWDADKDTLELSKHYFTSLFPSMLKMYVHYGRTFLQRTELPSVSLLQKTASSPVSCHATGFYPDRAVLFWRKDGEELYENVEHGEILPNHDGSFQTSVELNISSVNTEDWGRYECVFQLSGVKEDNVTKLDKAAIRSNEGSPSGFPAGLVPGVIVGLLLLLPVCIVGLFIWRRNNNGFQPANRK